MENMKVEFCYLTKGKVESKLVDFEEASKVKKEMDEYKCVRIRWRSEDGKAHTVVRGNFNWDNVELTVEVKFGDSNEYTYVTKEYIGINQEFMVNTTAGVAKARVCSECRYELKINNERKAKKHGYPHLTVLQDAIVKEVK